jgi:hypothetical protein
MGTHCREQITLLPSKWLDTRASYFLLAFTSGTNKMKRDELWMVEREANSSSRKTTKTRNIYCNTQHRILAITLPSLRAVRPLKRLFGYFTTLYRLLRFRLTICCRQKFVPHAHAHTHTHTHIYIYIYTHKYRVIKKSLCTWLRWLELGLTDGVSVCPPGPGGRLPSSQKIEPSSVWRLAGDALNITCNFLYCNHQAHRDFLITLYMRFMWNIREL